MIALAIKNMLLVLVMILILHVLLKSYLLDRKLMTVTVPIPIPTPEEPKQTPPPLPPQPKEPENPPVEAKKDDPKSLDNLFKYILETTPPTDQPSNSNPLGFDQRMFNNIDPFEDESASAMYQSWQ